MSLSPTFSSLYSPGLDSTESQGEEYTDFIFSALGVTSILGMYFNSCGLTLTVFTLEVDGVY